MENTLLKKFVRNQIHSLGLLMTRTVTLSQIIQKPWAIVDGDFEIQKLIFEKDGKLILSKNGIVQEGKWQYFPEANSFLIDRTNSKILCNLLFLDDSAFILKLDGTKDEYFAFANENKLPSLNLLEYLNRKILQRYTVSQIPLNTGQTLKLFIKNENYQSIDYSYVDLPVTIDNNEFVKDDFYFSHDYNYLYLIENGKISSKLNCTRQNLQGNRPILNYRDNYIFNSTGTPLTGKYCLDDSISYYNCDNGKIVEKYYLIRHKLGRNRFITLKQKDKKNVSLNDELESQEGFSDSYFNYQTGLHRIEIENNKVICVKDFFFALFVPLFIILILILYAIGFLLSKSA